MHNFFVFLKIIFKKLNTHKGACLIDLFLQNFQRCLIHQKKKKVLATLLDGTFIGLKFDFM